MNSEIPVFLINLDRSPERLASASREFARVGLSWTRVPAVDGGLLADAEFARLAPRPNRYYQPLSRGEVGCYLSHVECWRRLLETGAPAAAIFEDDFSCDDRLPEILQGLMRTRSPWDIVKLYGGKSGRIDHEPVVEGYQLVSHSRPAAHTVAQVVTRAAALRLLEQVPPFRRPIDMDQKWWWEPGLKMRAVHPAPVRASDRRFDSVISQDRTRRPPSAGVWLSRTAYRLGFTVANLRANAREHGPLKSLALAMGHVSSAQPSAVPPASTRRSGG